MRWLSPRVGEALRSPEGEALEMVLLGVLLDRRVCSGSLLIPGSACFCVVLRIPFQSPEAWGAERRCRFLGHRVAGDCFHSYPIFLLPTVIFHGWY